MTLTSFGKGGVFARSLVLLSLVGISPTAGADTAYDLGLMPLPVSAARLTADKAQLPRSPAALAKAGEVQALVAASAWMIAQQSVLAPSAGALPWTAGEGYFANTQGASALGWVRAFAHTGNAAHLNAARANGDCQLAGNACVAGFDYPDGDHRFASHDPLFLVELTAATGDTDYADFVETYLWQKFADGEYGAGNDLDAGDYADAVLASRSSQNIPELVAWDLSKIAIAADLAGHDAIASAILQRVQASLNLANATNDTYDVLGLAGGLWTAASLGTNLDPTSGTWAAANDNAGLATALLARQAPNGGFVYSTAVTVTDDNTDGQTTAFAIQALYATNRVLYRSQIAAAANYIESLQQASGQFLPYAGAPPNVAGGVESHGEMLEVYAVAWIRPDRYVDIASGTNDSDCSEPTAPCRTIQYAIDQADAGNTIHIASGVYIDPVAIAKPGLHLIGEGASQPIIDRSAGTANQHLLRIASARNVTIENLAFQVDKSFVGEAIVANGNVDGLRIRGNTIVQRWSDPGQSSTFKFTNAISINRGATDNSAGLNRFDGSAVTIENNSITGSALPNPTSFRACISMDASLGRIRDNPLLACGTHDLHMRFMSSVAGVSSASGVLIDGNTFGRRGLEISAPNATLPGGIVVQDNTFNAPADADNTALWGNFADYSLMRLIGNPHPISTTVVNNRFNGHARHFRGLLIENWPNVQVLGNEFAPKAGAGDFASLVLSNKEVTSEAPAAAPRTMTATVRANIFNDSGLASAGRAVELLNDNDANGSAAFGTLLFGGVGLANEFGDGHRWYFRLDDHQCNTHVADGPIGVCSFLGYNNSVTQPLSNTQVRAFRGDASAVNNLYGGLLPADMNPAQVNALFARTLDDRSNNALGIVDYGVGATAGDVYVDDGFAGSAYGDSRTFTHAGTGTITVHYGIDAFDSINAGIAAVAAGGRVFVAKGGYATAVTLGKFAHLLGDGADDTNPANSTVLTGRLTLAASGASAADPLRVEDLRANNAAGDGITLVGSQSHVWLQGVVSAGNAGNGLQVTTNNGAVSTLTTNLRIADSQFLDNGNPNLAANDLNGLVAGVLFDENASVDGLTIVDSSFSGNNAAGLSFNDIGAPSSDSIVRNVSISGSEFNRNNRVDGGSAGGGIWLKTSRAGSRIENVDIVDSVFADNGTGRSNSFPLQPARNINANGITIRVRAGTFFAGVRLCGNTFSDDPGTPGTQETGIYVFDQTNHTGYQPVEVCASNSFAGLAHSVSGYEQYGVTLTQPVVNITGGSLGNTENINAPVLRVRDGALFTSFNAAIADAATVAADVLRGGAGIYAENLVVNKPGLTLEGIRGATIIEGRRGPATTPTSSTSPGVRFDNGITGTTLQDLTIRNFASHCVLGALSNSDSIVRRIDALSCSATGPGGSIQFNGGTAIDHVTVADSLVDGGGVRGIVIWDGVKTDIAFTGNTVSNIAGCCGIELQDGAASGVRISGNVISNTGDNGIGAIGLTTGAGANIIAGNSITNAGRFGIEIKNPSGSGVDVPDASLGVDVDVLPDGAIVVANNSVTMTATAKADDVAGIAVMRRSKTALNADVPVGVIVRNNLVHGWSQPNANDGFGIVVEGLLSRVFGNTITGSDVAIQLQSGNDGYPGDSNQAATSPFFSRANSPTTCSFVGANSIDSAAVDGPTSLVSNPANQNLQGSVQNLTTLERFCSIQAAIADADTQAGHIIEVAAGTYRENVTINKSVTVRGPMHALTGFDPSRDGSSGEAILSPATGTALTLAANGAVFRGFTIKGTTGNAVLPGGANRNNLRFTNNRVQDIANGAGILFEPGEGSPASGFQIEGNLFANIRGASGTGIRLFKGTRDALVNNNRFDGMQQLAVQVNGGNGSVVDVVVTNNTALDSQALGTGTAYAITGSNQVRFQYNTSLQTGGGLFISDRTVDLEASCNTLDATGSALNASDFFSSAANSQVRIFHNAIRGGTADLRNAMAQGLTVGSNWYDGAAPGIGAPAVGLLVADALPVNPIGHALCGDNTAADLVLYAGNNQSAEVNQPFAQVLEARVVDPLGGAVMGESVTIAAPASGASALLTPVNGTPQLTNYNGVAVAAAIANGFAGSYSVNASHTSGNVAFALTNTAQDQVVLDLTGPLGGVEVGDEIAYAGFIGNSNSNVNERVFVHLIVGGTAALDPADVAMCVVNPSDSSQCLPFAWTDDGATLSFDFPGDLGGVQDFDITSPLPYAFTHALRTIYGEAGVFTATAQVIGSDTGTVYATDVIATEVIAQAAGIELDLNGPIAGVEKDVPTAYSARLTNSEAAVRDDVVVEFALTRSGGIAGGDVTVEYDLGGGNYAVIPLFDNGGELVAQFGGAGFELGAGYDATSHLRVTYHVAPDTFSVAATVIDASGNEDGVAAYAADQQSTEVIESDPDIVLTLQGPFTTAAGNTAAAARVGESAFFRSTLDNTGGDVADLVARTLQFGASYGAMSATDLSIDYWQPGGDSTCATQAAAPQQVALASDGVDGLTGTLVGSFALDEDLSATLCFEVSFERAGVLSLATLVVDAGADTDGRTAYAADNLSTTVAKGAATLALSGTGTFTWDGNPHAASVVTTPANLSAVTITYNGGATVPTDAGSYTVFATLDNPDYDADAMSGTIVIDKAAVNISGIEFAEGGTSVAYDGAPHPIVFNAAPAAGSDGIVCDATINGGSADPVAAGSYAIAIDCEGPNHSGSADATLTIARADSGIALTGGTFTYDGSPKPATVSNPNGSGFTLSYAGTGATSFGPTSTPPTDAGTYEATLTVDDPDFEEPSVLTAAIAIDPAGVSLTFGNLSHVYDGSAKFASVSTTPAGVAGITLDHAPDATPIDAGSYTVTAQLANPNYVLDGGNSATLTIAKATAQVSLSDLTQVFDGSAKPVVVTTVPAALSVAITYDGSAAAPSAVGHYDVVASVNEVNYQGTASGTLTILAAAISDFAIDGAATFDGTAGSPLAGARPSVRVLDANGDGVPSVTVVFAVTAGGGSGSGSVTTDANGIATVAAWTLGADAGTNTMTARVDGLAGLPTLTFTATGAEVADIAIGKTSTTTAAEAGQQVVYTIVVSNAGPSNAANVDVVDVIPDDFDVANAAWQCTGNGGALCNGFTTANGTGDIAVAASLPTGASITIILTATLDADAPIGQLANTATATLTSGTDNNAANDSATYEFTVLPQGGVVDDIFANGFEGAAAR